MFVENFSRFIIVLIGVQLVVVNGRILKENDNKVKKSIMGKNLDDSWMHPESDTPISNEPVKENRRRALEPEDTQFWMDSAQGKLDELLKQKNIVGKAKNLILFLGDGMSLATVAAARIYKGQSEPDNRGGEEGELHFENFPHTALSKTFCADRQVADSACSATAYLGGTKANYKTIGVTPKVLVENCTLQMDKANHVESILKWAQDAGKSTGIVTTTRITHASPAGTYAHIAHRDWEYDGKIADMGADPEACDDIAEQLILQEPGKSINVILGGGRRYFMNETLGDHEYDDVFGLRQDGKNLIQTWVDDKESQDQAYQFITTVDQLSKVDTSKIDYLLGLFAPDHLAYNDTIVKDEDPSLDQMTQVAIKILSKNPNGFFLFVEGGKIDHAHHDNWAKRALIETIEFDKAIKHADDVTNDDDTLIVVTADHAHVMTISGYPSRGNPLLHPVDTAMDDQGLPYATLSYANGPGYQHPHKNESGDCWKYNITKDDFDNFEYRQIAASPLGSETHGGDDVGIFAKGPFAHLFTGALHQNVIPHVMGYAGCVGHGTKFCDTTSGSNSYLKSSFGQNLVIFILPIFSVFKFM